MSRDENIAAQKHLAGNINVGNVEAAVETFAEDAVDHDPAPGQGAGREGFKAFFTALTTAFPDAHIAPVHVVADDEHVAIAYTLTGTQEGDFNGLAPTGRRSKFAGYRSDASRTERSSSAGAAATSWAFSSKLGVDPTAG